jgi:hypothetical protein
MTTERDKWTPTTKVTKGINCGARDPNEHFGSEAEIAHPTISVRFFNDEFTMMNDSPAHPLSSGDGDKVVLTAKETKVDKKAKSDYMIQ